MASATPRHATVRDPERIHRAVVRRRWDFSGDGRKHSQVCHERADIFFVPVRSVVSDHALPMEGATVGSDAASNGSGDLFVGPRADSCSHVISEVATPCFLRKSKLVAIPLKPGQQLERRTSIFVPVPLWS